jgi:hypothetical protein
MHFFFYSKYLFTFIFLNAIFSFQVFAETLVKEATFYSDSFDGNQTANGDRFDQKWYSAAICNIPLDQYIHVSNGRTGIVLDANDRPNCSSYPQVIDLSREAFRTLAPLSTGRIPDVKVTPIGPAPTNLTKKFLPVDTFRHLGIILDSQIPTVVFSGEGMEIRGKTVSNDSHVLIYALWDGKSTSLLAPVDPDKSFRGFIKFPDIVGDIVFVVASGNSFDTDQYATLSLISPASLSYPILPTERLRYTPRITSLMDKTPLLSLPKWVVGELQVTQWVKKYTTRGNLLLFEDLPFRIGEARVEISGYRISTPSSLDRSARYGMIFSGSVFLDRSHDSIGRDKVSIQQRWNIANFRITTPKDIRLRKNYYITKPDGKALEVAFAKNITSGEFLKWGIPVTGSLNMDQVWTYLFEIVREDGIAYVNIPITRWAVWPLLDPIPEDQVSTVRQNTKIIIESILSRINTIRKQASRSPIVLDTRLSKIADAKVKDMIKRNYQGHADPDGNYIDTLARNIWIDPGWSIGENIGFGTVSDLALQDGLEESGVHRINMQNPEWTRVGIGYGVSGEKVYLVHIFGE